MPRVTTWKDLLKPGNASSFFGRAPLPLFDSAAINYRWENAWWLAELCRLVYRHDAEEDANPRQPRRSEFLAEAGLKQLQFFSDSKQGTQGFLVQTINAPLFSALVFRGTEDVRDARTDIELPLVPFGVESLRVHQGFLEAFKPVWAAVEAALGPIQGPVFYAGHSLGAALATLAAARRPPQALYTFGSPRVGNQAFVDHLSGIPVFRVVDDEDAVTLEPPEALGYRHAGALHQLRAPSPTPPVPWLRRLLGPAKPLADHAPVNYVERLHA